MTYAAKKGKNNTHSIGFPLAATQRYSYQNMLLQQTCFDPSGTKNDPLLRRAPVCAKDTGSCVVYKKTY